MEPDRTLDINRCKKCGSSHFKLNYFYKAKVKGDYHFFWETDGFFIRPQCGDCGHTPAMRWFDTAESAIQFWNDGF